MKKLLTLFGILAFFAGAGVGLIATDVIQFKKNPAATTSEKTGAQKNQQPEKKEPEILPPNYAEHLAKGDELAEKKHYTLAFSEYILANKLSPDSIEPLLKIGKLHYERKDYEKAREVFQQILLKNNSDLETEINLGRAYIQMGKTEKALEVFNSIQAVNQLVSWYKGILYVGLGQYENSKKFLQEAIDINTNNDRTELAKSFLKSYETFATSQGSQMIYLKTLLAKNLNQAEEFRLAIPLLFDVVKEKKDYRDAWILLGYAYLNVEDAKNAIDALEQAQKLDPHKPEILFFLGLAYQIGDNGTPSLENKQKAARMIEEALKKGFEPKIQAKQKLAELYMDLGNYEKAAQNYEDVINLNSEDLDYFTRPMWLYIDKLGNPQKALQLAQKAIQAHPDKAMSFNFLGWALIANKDYQNARENLSKALALDPNLAAAYLNFGKLFEDVQYSTTAKDYYKKAFELGKGTSVGDMAAQRYNAIIEDEKRAFQANTTSP